MTYKEAWNLVSVPGTRIVARDAIQDTVFAKVGVVFKIEHAYSVTLHGVLYGCDGSVCADYCVKGGKGLDRHWVVVNLANGALAIEQTELSTSDKIKKIVDEVLK